LTVSRTSSDLCWSGIPWKWKNKNYELDLLTHYLQTLRTSFLWIPLFKAEPGVEDDVILEAHFLGSSALLPICGVDWLNHRIDANWSSHPAVQALTKQHGHRFYKPELVLAQLYRLGQPRSWNCASWSSEQKLVSSQFEQFNCLWTYTVGTLPACLQCLIAEYVKL
jgi:hypothetical protein